MEILDDFCCFGWERSGGCSRNVVEVMCSVLDVNLIF